MNLPFSTPRQLIGVNHLGFQVDSDEELRGMQAQRQAADSKLIQENEQPCCYARSDKYWVADPTGIAWETFHTLGNIPQVAVYSGWTKSVVVSTSGRGVGTRLLGRTKRAIGAAQRMDPACWRLSGGKARAPISPAFEVVGTRRRLGKMGFDPLKGQWRDVLLRTDAAPAST